MLPLTLGLLFWAPWNRRFEPLSLCLCEGVSLGTGEGVQTTVDVSSWGCLLQKRNLGRRLTQ